MAIGGNGRNPEESGMHWTLHKMRAVALGAVISCITMASSGQAQDRLSPLSTDPLSLQRSLGATDPTMNASLPQSLSAVSDPSVSAPMIAPLPGSCDQSCDQPGCFFMDAEYLLLRPRRRAFDFAITDPSSKDAPIGSIESLEWRTRSGVRVGGGYAFPGDGWEAGAYYTYLHSDASAFVAKPSGGTLFATLTHPGTIEQVDTALATSGINFNVVDVELARRFNTSERLAFRVFGGARFASIDQSLNAFYNGVDANLAEVHRPIEFDGAGIRVGGEGYWNINWGLSLFASASGSLLFGDFRSTLIQTNNNGATTDVNVVDDFEKIVPVIEMGIGVAWQYRNVQVKVGYEISNWFGLVDSPDFVDAIHQGKLAHRVSDLSLDGLDLQVRLSF
jgi:hypothetical protein